MSGFTIKADIGGMLAGIDSLAADIDNAARPAAQAGAQVFYDQVVANVAGIRKKTGNLRRSIYQVYSKDRSAIGKAVYQIGWNAKKAPHGHLVEFGHLQRYEVTYDPKTGRYFTHKDRPIAPIQIAAKPFLNPAKSRAPQAQDAMEQRFFVELQKSGAIK